ncbi:MAG: hypothetical protein ACTHL3_06200, partial [Candidatus Nitrosocosmicus sp.]
DKFVKYNKLNILESKFMTVIADNLNAKKIIVDSCDVNPFRFQQEIKKNLNNKEISIYSFHKADSDNIIVSSASIIAKVTRDKEISKIKKNDRKRHRFRLSIRSKNEIISKSKRQYNPISKPHKTFLEASQRDN